MSTSSIPQKRCIKCGDLKPISEFHKSKHEKDGHRRDCKTCRSDYIKEDRKNNPEKYRSTLNRWRRNNPDRNKQLAKNYRIKHADTDKARTAAWHKKNPDKIKLYSRYWQQNNQHLVNIKTQRRKTRKRQLPDNFTTQDWKYCLDYFDQRCAVCGRPRGLFHTLAMDHWIPLSDPLCPGTIPGNIVPLCHSMNSGIGGCNNQKHNSDPVQWLTNKVGKRKAQKVLRRITEYFNHLQGSISDIS